MTISPGSVPVEGAGRVNVRNPRYPMDPRYPAPPIFRITKDGPWAICPEIPWRVEEDSGDYPHTLHQAATWDEALAWLIRAWPVIT